MREERGDWMEEVVVHWTMCLTHGEVHERETRDDVGEAA